MSIDLAGTTNDAERLQPPELTPRQVGRLIERGGRLRALQRPASRKPPLNRYGMNHTPTITHCGCEIVG